MIFGKRFFYFILKRLKLQYLGYFRKKKKKNSSRFVAYKKKNSLKYIFVQLNASIFDTSIHVVNELYYARTPAVGDGKERIIIICES